MICAVLDVADPRPIIGDGDDPIMRMKVLARSDEVSGGK
jgi:hypothetical protein